MIDQSTIKAFRELRLPAMARELESQFENPKNYIGLGFEERLAMMVDAERTQRNNNTIQRRIRDGHFTDRTACVERIEYPPDRWLDKGQILRLATYIASLVCKSSLLEYLCLPFA